MTYENSLEIINSLKKFGNKPGLYRIKKLLNYLGNPQKNLRFIHVAGTNGKGSTCAFISSILTHSGIKTGLFISPFIIDFRERMQINGNMISKKKFAEIVEYITPFLNIMKNDGEYITEFELITIVALLWFYREKCDIVVLEVGLGGRLDATNVIEKSLISVITAVDYDHMNILGEEIEQIAYEKAGILKNNGILVLYPIQKKSAISVIKNVAEKFNNKIVFPNLNEITNINFNLQYTTFTYKGKNFKIRLLGKHQIYNAITALTVVYELINLGFNLSYDKIELGLWNTFFPARFEVLSEKPLVILDGAHNPNGALSLANSIDLYLSKIKIIAIVGMLKDKDVEKVLQIIAPKVSRLIITQPNNIRAMNKLDLREFAFQFNINCTIAENIDNAVKIATTYIDNNSALLVFGSLYLASQIRPMLT